MAKKENVVLWRKTAENRDYNSPPYITASQWSHDQVSQPIIPFKLRCRETKVHNVYLWLRVYFYIECIEQIKCMRFQFLTFSSCLMRAVVLQERVNNDLETSKPFCFVKQNKNIFLHLSRHIKFED